MGGREEGEGLVVLEKPYKLSDYGSVCTFVNYKPKSALVLKGGKKCTCLSQSGYS